MVARRHKLPSFRHCKLRLRRVIKNHVCHTDCVTEKFGQLLLSAFISRPVVTSVNEILSFPSLCLHIRHLLHSFHFFLPIFCRHFFCTLPNVLSYLLCIPPPRIFLFFFLCFVYVSLPLVFTHFFVFLLTLSCSNVHYEGALISP
jgi:hypothetical protein